MFTEQQYKVLAQSMLDNGLGEDQTATILYDVADKAGLSEFQIALHYLYIDSVILDVLSERGDPVRITL